MLSKPLSSDNHDVNKVSNAELDPFPEPLDPEGPLAGCRDYHTIGTYHIYVSVYCLSPAPCNRSLVRASTMVVSCLTQHSAWHPRYVCQRG